jgi:hypothetical protein
MERVGLPSFSSAWLMAALRAFSCSRSTAADGGAGAGGSMTVGLALMAWVAGAPATVTR